MCTYARSLRKERTNLTRGRLDSPTFEGADQLIDDYLALAAKSKALDDLIKALKEECAGVRSECNHILTKIRSPSAKRRHALRNKECLAHGLPESGFADREAIAERIILAESTATSVAGVVGAFGAGITYTTIFSASRGRIDLISWAFTCFLIVVVDCAALQVFALPRHGQIARIIRMEYIGSAENRLLIYMVLIGVPMIIGFLLLGVTVAVMDADAAQAVSGSTTAIRAAGYLPVAILGYFVILMVLVASFALIVRLLPRRFHPGAKDMPSGFGTIMSPLREKLYFLPGGPGYSFYRQKHIHRRTL
ncbi:hypothetical protein K439DRAFT_1663150 [Ramaria rubella]|nr:hypothetical protein K439DRAFT_1663150 [Ramaria rubella]